MRLRICGFIILIIKVFIYFNIFRYACKLTLDEVFSTTDYSSKVVTFDADMEEEIFTQLNLFEREYEFCSPQEIPVNKLSPVHRPLSLP